MKALYIECKMGAAGDMLTAALLELLDSPEKFVEKLNNIGIPKVKYILEKAEKCGISGSHMSVLVDGEEEGDGHRSHHHHHSSLHGIEHIVSHLDIPEKVKGDVLGVYKLIAEAESSVHGVPVSDIHFHEVGTLDAVADVTAVCLLINEIAPDEIAVSPINTGSGTVKCAHGVLPVPAPATAYILKNIPIYNNEINGELCTPTGAALLKYFASRFGSMPEMSIDKIGYGMGKKDFEEANCVRAILGESAGSTEGAVEISFSVDDMTAEAISFACEILLENGAKDVFTTPAGMKKSRLGYNVTVVCSEDKKSDIIKLIFRHTTTIGVRECVMKRYTLEREIKTFSTKYGEVKVKYSKGYGVERSKLEYEDIARIAKENGFSFSEAEGIIKEEIYG